VAQRRLPGLIAAGAVVVVVAPAATPSVEGLADGAEITWLRREIRPEDLDGAWYVLAATSDPAVNAAVSAWAEARHTFCVRADDVTGGSAWTPAVARHGGFTVAVQGPRNPRATAALRDLIQHDLVEGRLSGEVPHGTPGVVLVGGGPGDPGLITVAGRRALAEADVVIVDRLGPRELLSDLPSTVEVIDVGKLPRGSAATQEEINRLLVEHARAGKCVVRLKGGDNFVFGRGYEEILACIEAGVPYRVVPGVTSAISVPALAGIPVTHRQVAQDFTVISGHVPPGHEGSLVDWASAGRNTGTLVLLMAVDNLSLIAAELIRHGRNADTPVAIVCDGSMPTERTVRTTLGQAGATVAAESIRPPAIVVVGDVVALGR
jgi:uroporphyrin-III C-methyltransferase/precorrin-2 dehydrogenase/sirohydrochlorin ferrochelatase